MLELEQTLEIHSSDIKDVFLGPEVRVTCSRDSTIKAFHKGEQYTLCPERGYVNCLAVTPSLGVYAGCQDGTIVFYSSFAAEPAYITGHRANVCALDYRGRLLSGSWDHFLNEWNAETIVFAFEHPGTVWSCRYITEKSFASACADTKVRVFHSGALKAEILYHFHCVRSLWVHKDIYAVSNEGMLVQISANGDLVKYANHNSLVYSVYVDDEHSILAGDKGLVIVDGDVQHFPVATFWKATFFHGKVYAAGSDGKLYVLRKGRHEEAPGDAQGAAEEKAEETQAGEEHAKDAQEDNFQGQKKKVVNGKVYVLVNNEWVLLGDVVKDFDHTFSVDVEGRSLQLSFNDDENVFDVADRFLKKHKLKEQYRDEIVEFINKNFKKVRAYHVYDKVNYAGIEGVLAKYPSSAILENLKTPRAENSAEIEKNLRDLMHIGERFVLLDCYRYFVAMGLDFDFAFLSRFVPRDRKEALVFVKLVTNLYARPPFNLESLRDRIRQAQDRGLVAPDALDKYESNRETSRK